MPCRARPHRGSGEGDSRAEPGSTAFLTLAAVDEGVLQPHRVPHPGPGRVFLRQAAASALRCLRDLYGRLIDGKADAPRYASAAAAAIPVWLDNAGAPRVDARIAALFSGPGAHWTPQGKASDPPRPARFQRTAASDGGGRRRRNGSAHAEGGGDGARAGHRASLHARAILAPGDRQPPDPRDASNLDGRRAGEVRRRRFDAEGRAGPQRVGDRDAKVSLKAGRDAPSGHRRSSAVPQPARAA